MKNDAKGKRLHNDKQNSPKSQTFVNFSTFVENMRGVRETKTTLKTKKNNPKNKEI